MPNFFALNEQEINFVDVFIPIVGSGALITVEQDVNIIEAGALITIEQRVTQSVSSHLARTGWDATLTINNIEVNRCYIHGDMVITRTESTASLMEVTLIPALGVQDLDAYSGADITLDVTTASGTQRMFTGVVDIPEVDLIERKITLRCTDKRTELINSQFANTIKGIGYFSPLIFTNVKDVAQELSFRLSTVPFAVDFDPYGNYTLTPWAAKATPDFTLDGDTVYYDRPQVLYTSRGRVTNQFAINFEYRYERLYHMERTFQWQHPIATDICKLLLDGYSLTFRDMVRSAAEATGWPIKGDITYTDLHPSGWYRCGQQGQLPIDIGWSTVQFQQATEGTGATDASGNPIYTGQLTGGIDFAPLYCMGAQWTGTTRWAQTLTEDYSLTVDAPQSQDQYGIITTDTSIGVQSEFDAKNWENYQFFTDEGQPPGNYSITQDNNRAEFDNAVITALNRGKTSILKSHRDTRVLFTTFLWPELDLRHTVEVDTDEVGSQAKVHAKGKVFQIRHSIDVGTGEAKTETTLMLSRIPGAPVSESTLVPPAPPTDDPTLGSGNIVLGNHFAQDPTTPQAAAWTGMVGNRWTIENNNKFRTTYQEQFIVDTPAIADAARLEKNLAQTQSYTVSIPNDILVVTF